MESDGDCEGGGAKSDADQVEGFVGRGAGKSLVGGEGEIVNLEGRHDFLAVDGNRMESFGGVTSANC